MDFTRELKKPCNMKVTVIPVVIGALGTVPKYLIAQSAWAVEYADCISAER